MSYYMNQRDSDFRIKRINFDAALSAIIELADDKYKDHMNGGSWYGGKHSSWCYSWVDMDELKNAKTIEQAISAWFWEVEVEVEDDIVDIRFCGEKLGQEEIMFDAIAPFVEDDSYIEMEGEGGEIWRWTFKAGVCIEVAGTVVFE